MKTPRFLGPVLALCLPGLVAFVPTLQSRASEPRRIAPSPARSVEVRHREGARYLLSTSLPAVTEVRASVDRALSLSGPGTDAAGLARATLERRYGERMTQVSSAPGYVWWWNGERWVIVCLSTVTFAVDFGPYGSVEVETRDWVDVP